MFGPGAEALYAPGGGLSQATGGSAGFDLRAVLPGEQPVTINPGERAGIKSGIFIEPQAPGFAAFIFSRSGLGAVKGLTLAQGVGVIDPDYRGEITCFMLNTSKETHEVKHGDRIAQMVFMPFLQPVFTVAQSLNDSERGAGGFGHTGVK